MPDTLPAIAIRCSYSDLRSLSSLLPHPRNPNQHPPSQISALAKLILYQGWRAPIVISSRSGFIVAGHGRYAAAKLLGVNVVPVDVQDFPDEASELAHLLADNQIAELAELDDQQVKALLSDLSADEFDLTLTGFTTDETEKLLGTFSVDGCDAPDLPDGDKQPFRQVTFMLHDTQAEVVDAALEAAKAEGGDVDDVNKNTNANAIAYICRQFLNGRSQDNNG